MPTIRTKVADLPPELREALERVLAMAEEMSGETSYAEVDYSDPSSGGVRIGVDLDVQHDLNLVRAWLQGAIELPRRRRRT